MVERLATRPESAGEVARVLSVLRSANREALATYLGTTLPRGEPTSARAHVDRASASVLGYLRDKEGEDAELLRTSAERDLSIALAETPSKLDATRAMSAALALEKAELAGRFAARALAIDEGPRGLGFGLLKQATAGSDRYPAASLSKGMLEEAPRSGAAGFAKAVAEGLGADPLDLAGTLKEVESLADDPASQIPALYLAVRLAFLLGDPERAETDAQRLVDLVPGDLEARELLGDLWLQRRNFEPLVDLHKELGERSFHPYRQKVSALMALERAEEALEVARRAVTVFPRSAPAHILLARIHIFGGRDDEALGVLNASPQTPEVARLKARLLAKRKEYVQAEMLYAGLLGRNAFDLDAWRGLMGVLQAQERADALVEPLTQLLDAPPAKKLPGVARGLRLLRAMAREAGEDFEGAIEDYEAALEGEARDVVALNNVAWLILQHEPERIGDAEKLIAKAVELVPEQPNVLDTAAAIYMKLGQTETALDLVLREAKARRRVGQDAKAKADLEKLIEEHPDSPQAGEAASLLQEAPAVTEASGGGGR